MARQKTLPVTLRTKHVLAERIIALRMELFGPRGGPELARRLGIPVRTWYNYEGGITVPGEILLKIIEVTSVEPMWLLRGTGPRFSDARRESNETLPPPASKAGVAAASAAKSEIPTKSHVAVCILLKAALKLLGSDEADFLDVDKASATLAAIESQADALEHQASGRGRNGVHHHEQSTENGSGPMDSTITS
jgi:hypothetical protein